MIIVSWLTTTPSQNQAGINTQAGLNSAFKGHRYFLSQLKLIVTGFVIEELIQCEKNSHKKIKKE